MAKKSLLCLLLAVIAFLCVACGGGNADGSGAGDIDTTTESSDVATGNSDTAVESSEIASGNSDTAMEESSDIATVNTENNDIATTPIRPEANWQFGVYPDAALFKNYCATPRSGMNINGNAYPDKAGSMAHEQLWLRSWSNDTYLWYRDLIDRDIAEYNTPQSYFADLRSTALTASGNFRDRFHFAQSTEEYTQLVSSGGVSASYGFKIKIVRAAPPREVRVVYTEPGSPARNAGLLRGTEILSVDGVSVRDGDHVAINNGLFPENNGETHRFTVRNVGETTIRTVTMQAGAVTVDPVHNTRVIDTPTGKVGYLPLHTFATFEAESEVVTAIETLAGQNISDLVIDLRYNGGGYLPIAAELAYMVAGSAQSAGKTFDRLMFNDKHPVVDPFTGSLIQPMPFLNRAVGYSLPRGQILPVLNLSRVYVLTTGATCSASEALINGLRGIDIDVVLIGSTTCGKPYGFYPTDNCGTTYSTIQFRGENDKRFGDYADGFSPINTTEIAGELLTGCYVEDDLLHPLGDEQEAMLQAALTYRMSGVCPVVAVNRTPQSLNPAMDLNNDPRVMERALKERIVLDALRLER